MNGEREALRAVYGFDFPDEFFAFRDFASTKSGRKILDALEVGLEGPFQWLEGASDHRERPHTASRYYDDPPEFFTVLSGGDGGGLHHGYYLDHPGDGQFCVAGFYGRDAFELSIDGNTLFEVVRGYLEFSYESALEDMELGFNKAENRRLMAKLDRLRAALMVHATGDRPEIGADYANRYEAGRHRHVVAQTFEHMGIVVPERLYRPLEGTDFAELQGEPELSDVEHLEKQAMSLLLDGYPGTALKLGKDLWISRVGRESSYRLLQAAYNALERPLLMQMVDVAREYRIFCDAGKAKS
jgi:hypothetical protein